MSTVLNEYMMVMMMMADLRPRPEMRVADSETKIWRPRTTNTAVFAKRIGFGDLTTTSL